MGSKPSTQRKIIVPDLLNLGHSFSGENKEDTNEPSYGNPLLVIAIDFGTTYSGYVFCFKGIPDKIWTGAQGFSKERVPTIILLNPDQTFNSFGYEAQETYSKLGEEKSQYFYFEHFKLAMYKNIDSSNTDTLADTRGRQVNAKEIFVMLITNLLHLAIDIVQGLQSDDISWIITLPALGAKSVRKIIKQSAMSAGIEEGNLHFILEPHAAAVCCLREDEKYQEYTYEFADNTGKLRLMEHIDVGDKCIILDIGGGSTDIWVYEIEDDNKFKELHKATEEIGGHSVNAEFIDLMEGLVGETVWYDFKEKHTAFYNTLMEDFDRKKCSFSSEVEVVKISVANELIDLLEDRAGDTFYDVLTRIGAGEKIQFKSQFNKLQFDKETMQELFEKSVVAIVQLVEKTLRVCQKWDIHTMYMVGGFSESPYLREIIKSRFSEIRVIFHSDAKFDVLKGAVIIGHQSQFQ